MLADPRFTDPSLRFLLREGEMRARIRGFDWRTTDLGPPETWPPVLKMALTIMLDSASAAYVAWGPKHYQFYNDAYIPILGPQKHRDAVGRTTAETWAEIWHEVQPLFEQVERTGVAIWHENHCFPMQRSGYLEECFFSFSYSPLADESGTVQGLYVAVWETTEGFVEHRRKNVLRLLAQALSRAESMAEAERAFEEALGNCVEDVPLALWYSRSLEEERFSLTSAIGAQAGTALAPLQVTPDTPGPLGRMLFLEGDLPTVAPLDTGLAMQCTVHPTRRPQSITIHRVAQGRHAEAQACLVIGVNPMRPFDDGQREFLQNLAGHLESALWRINRAQSWRREQEFQFLGVMSALPCMVWLSDAKGRCVFVNQSWLSFTGRRLHDELGDGWLSCVHLDDQDRVRDCFVLRSTQQAADFEFRLRNAAGQFRLVLGRAVPRLDMAGRCIGTIGTCLDINDRKDYEERIFASERELHLLYQRLQRVRQEERQALAREVHDQLGQLLSAAKIDIKLLETAVASGKRMERSAIVQELQSAQGAIESAIGTARRLARELRPPVLENQGFVEALRWHLPDFERRTRIACTLEVCEQFPALDPERAQALFGIYQEAMTNVLRHSQAASVRVRLDVGQGLLKMAVCDDGVGAPPAALEGGRSLGMRGMRERAAGAGGRLAVHPAQPRGLRVEVEIPLPSGTAVQCMDT